MKQIKSDNNSKKAIKFIGKNENNSLPLLLFNGFLIICQIKCTSNLGVWVTVAESPY